MPTSGQGVPPSAASRIARTPWPDVGMTLVLGAAYLVLGAVFLRYFEVAARKHATLSLT